MTTLENLRNVHCRNSNASDSELLYRRSPFEPTVLILFDEQQLVCVPPTSVPAVILAENRVSVR
ncbi:hypothetical protein ACFRFQ_10135 [Rhodococcus sp. NPDC056743]|uniref:hypothetical protein n=1 Tax=Rhodococcus sp. NPDC056743 TaxID=3345934 RepID=UPI0036715F72